MKQPLCPSYSPFHVVTAPCPSFPHAPYPHSSHPPPPHVEQVTLLIDCAADLALPPHPSLLCPTPHSTGVEMIKLLIDYGVDLDAATPKNWTPLSYSKAKGKYGATEEKGIYPEVRMWMGVGGALVVGG